MKGIGVVCLALLTVVPITGCGEDRPSNADHEARSNDVDMRTVEFPLRRYDFTDDELQLTSHARYVLTRRCVRDFDASLPHRDIGPLRPPAIDRYGISDERLARSWAYSLDRPPETVPPWEAKIDPDSRLFAIVNGVRQDGRPAKIAGLPDGGCGGQANRTLRRGAALGTRDPIPALDSRAWTRSRESAGVRAAVRSWARCLVRAGYDYDEKTLEEPSYYWTRKRVGANPHPTPQQRKTGVKPSPAERRAAVADVRCKRTSGLLRTWLDAEIAAQRDQIAAHSEQLERHRNGLDRLVANAKQVLEPAQAAG